MRPVFSDNSLKLTRKEITSNAILGEKITMIIITLICGN